MIPENNDTKSVPKPTRLPGAVRAKLIQDFDRYQKVRQFPFLADPFRVEAAIERIRRVLTTDDQIRMAGRG